MSKNKKPKAMGKSKGKRRNFGRYYKGPNPTKDDDLTKFSGKLFQRYLDLGFNPEAVRNKIESLEIGPQPPPGLLDLFSASNAASYERTDSEIRLLKKYCRQNGIQQACRTYFMSKIDKGIAPIRAMQQAIMFREVSACYKPISHDKRNLKDFCERNRICGRDKTTFMDLIKKGYKPKDALLHISGEGEQQQVEYRNLTWRRGMNSKNANIQTTSASDSKSHSFSQKEINCDREKDTHSTNFTCTPGNSSQASAASNIRSGATDGHPDNDTSATSLTFGSNNGRRDKNRQAAKYTFSPKLSPAASDWEKEIRMTLAGEHSSTSNDSFPNYGTVAVLPRRYPEKTLGKIELSILENAIIEEIGRGWEVNIQISRIHYKRDMLVIDCENRDTVKWVMFVAHRLNAWKGVDLMARIETASPAILMKN